ncbi:MAG: hypothetical protein CL758_01280 [Chloroflexi bacterium]|nr:hypothetical protein [Chloroflexota bacterium]|tara:strand:+ start:15785 stop:16732 length:948 start_codon:yes stop_codon:yes gene_type:complete
MFYRIINRLLISTFTMFIISLGLYIFIVAPGHKNLNINELDRIHSQLQQTGNANYYSGVNNYVFKSYYRWIKGSYKSIKNHYLLRERSQNTLILLLLTMFFTLTISFLFGFYSAVFKDSLIDRLLMLFGTIGVALPSFLLALFLLWITIQWFDITAGGFFSTEYLEKNWSLDRVLDFVKHVSIPVFVLSIPQIAVFAKILRNNMIDEMNSPYVLVALSKGLSKHYVLIKYPLRLALLPFISILGYIIPTLISQSMIVEAILNLPTLGPVILESILKRDGLGYAPVILLFLGFITVIGTMLSDILLLLLDRRINYT